MKILMINRALYARSPADAAMLILADELRSQGHTVTFFTRPHARNLHLPHVYVVDPPDNESARRRYQRLVYDEGLVTCLCKYLHHERPDAALVWQVDRSLTHSVLYALHKEQVPAWMMLTDMSLLCPGRSMVCAHPGLMENCRRLYRRAMGIPYMPSFICDDCARGLPAACVTRRCAGRRKDSLLAAHALWYARSRGLFGLVEGFLAPSEYHCQRFSQAGLDRPILSVDFPLHPHAFPSFNIHRGDYFLFAGTLSEPKGVFQLLQALKYTANDLPLMVAGEGPGKDRLVKMALEMNVADRVFLQGTLSAADLQQLMAGSLCVITPSLCEEIAPMSLLQAQALGKPVIVSDIGVLPERVQDGRTGYVFTPEPTGIQLAQRMDAVVYLSPEEYADMCTAAHTHALEHYSPQAYAQRVLDAID